MLPPNQIIPAIPGTLLLHFRFFASIKASDGQVKDGTIRRPVICWSGRPVDAGSVRLAD
jgi:hypothetical protein